MTSIDWTWYIHVTSMVDWLGTGVGYWSEHFLTHCSILQSIKHKQKYHFVCALELSLVLQRAWILFLFISSIRWPLNRWSSFLPYINFYIKKTDSLLLVISWVVVFFFSSFCPFIFLICGHLFLGRGFCRKKKKLPLPRLAVNLDDMIISACFGANLWLLTKLYIAWFAEVETGEPGEAVTWRHFQI